MFFKEGGSPCSTEEEKSGILKVDVVHFEDARFRPMPRRPLDDVRPSRPMSCKRSSISSTRGPCQGQLQIAGKRVVDLLEAADEYGVGALKILCDEYHMWPRRCSGMIESVFEPTNRTVQVV